MIEILRLKIVKIEYGPVHICKNSQFFFFEIYDQIFNNVFDKQ